MVFSANAENVINKYQPMLKTGRIFNIGNVHGLFYCILKIGDYDNVDPSEEFFSFMFTWKGQISILTQIDGHHNTGIVLS